MTCGHDPDRIENDEVTADEHDCLCLSRPSPGPVTVTGPPPAYEFALRVVPFPITEQAVIVEVTCGNTTVYVVRRVAHLDQWEVRNHPGTTQHSTLRESQKGAPPRFDGDGAFFEGPYTEALHLAHRYVHAAEVNHLATQQLAGHIANQLDATARPLPPPAALDTIDGEPVVYVPPTCGAWPTEVDPQGCIDAPGHNQGLADVPANHTFRSTFEEW